MDAAEYGTVHKAWQHKQTYSSKAQTVTSTTGLGNLTHPQYVHTKSPSNQLIGQLTHLSTDHNLQACFCLPTSFGMRASTSTATSATLGLRPLFSSVPRPWTTGATCSWCVQQLRYHWTRLCSCGTRRGPDSGWPCAIALMRSQTTEQPNPKP